MPVETIPLTPEEETTKALLVLLWTAIPPSYKSFYRRTIWQQFEEHVRAAALSTATLKRLSSLLCAVFAAQVLRRDVAAFQHLCTSGQDGAVLRLLRRETAFCVALVRAETERRKAEWEARSRAEEEEDGDLDPGGDPDAAVLFEP